MLELQIDQAERKTVNGHQYYVFPTAPPAHTNYQNRPSGYTDQAKTTAYNGRGSNGSALLLPDVHTPANTLMSALLDYGDQINDWSMKSAVIQNGFRPDDDTQGSEYLRILKVTMANDPATFGKVTFPSSLEDEAKGVLGAPGDPRRTAFHNHLQASPGWNADLVSKLFYTLDRTYAPRGSNPHTTGFVFDLDFMVYVGGKEGEKQLKASTALNNTALKCAVGMWLNQYSMQFNFDSYDTSIEVFHQEYRKPKAAAPAPAGKK